MRVVFIWFNTAGPVGISHGVLILARELIAAGHEVDVLHLHEEQGLTSEQALAQLEARPPEVVALSFGSPHADQARRMVPAIKAVAPAATVVCGGIHTTLAPDEVFSWPGVDAIGLGELDNGPFVDFVACLETGGAAEREGFWVRDHLGEHRNRLAPLPALEDQALPHWEAVDIAGLVAAKRGFGEIIAGRGCPNRCRFCQNHALVKRYRTSLPGAPGTWPYCRIRSVSNVLAELKLLMRLAPEMKAVMFGDDRLAANRDWLVEFAARYPDDIGLPFIVNATAEQIDEESARLLAQAGCNMVKMGVECAPGRIRREVLGRPHDEQRITTAFGHCRAAGLNTMAYIMVGIPGESADDVAATYRFTAALRPDAVRLAMFCPFPGTEIHAELVSRGLIEDTRMVYGFLRRSVLKWPDEMHLLLEKVLMLHPWILNSHLDGRVGATVADFVSRALAVSQGTFEDEAYRRELFEQQRSLSVQLAQDDRPHYFAPFGERPDWAFLRAERSRPLINVGNK